MRGGKNGWCGFGGAALEVRLESETKQRQFWQLGNGAQLVMSHIFRYCVCVLPSKLDSDSI